MLSGRSSLAEEKPRAETAYSFQRDILPILSKNCFACHGPDEEHREGGLRLDLQTGAVAKLESGVQAIVPGKPDESELIVRIQEEDETLRMPPPKHGPMLKPEQQKLLKAWIRDGGKYLEHWAYIPPQRNSLPEIQHPEWARNPVDHFIAAKLEEAGMQPAPEADRYTLIRRLSLDLRGLPPTLQEVEQFVNDSSPRAYEDLVERMLQDPAFGERFGRMWLDLARYADSRGFGSDPLRPHIWRYRDWVIEAFNRNLPFDQFTIEQIAGDLLPNPTLEQQIATAFHRNTMTNTEGGTDDEEFRVAAVKDRSEVTMQVWMGLTFGCAQCHNHKYDPLSQKEYYQLTAFFNQSADYDQPDERPTIPAPTEEMLAQNAKIDREIAALKQKLDQTTPELEAAQQEWEASLKLPQDWTSIEVRKSGNEETAWDVTTPSSELTGIRAIRWKKSPQEAGLQIRRVAPEQDSSAKGQFVRIELPGERKILSLAEVEVLDGETNIAREGKATQSSTGYGGPPERAIDGNTSGVFTEGSVTHTNEEGNPWWEVDLGSEKVITGIRIWNRLDDVSNRLEGFRVVVLDAQRQPKWERSQIPAPEKSLALETRLNLVDPIRLSAIVGGDDGVYLLPEATDLRTGPIQFLLKGAGESVELELNRDAGFTTRQKTAEEILKLVDVPKEQRTAEQAASLATHFRSFTPLLEGVRKEIAALEQSRPAYPQLPIMQELALDQHRKSYVMVKGNFLVKGDEVEPVLPAAFSSEAERKPGDRMDLARWLVSPSNPLTARVMVNRLWSQIFSRGLVETEEDFGTQGELPSHPALLDWMAVEFQSPGSVESGTAWDMKRIIRLMVTSATYRQSSQVTQEHLDKDSQNRLYSRGARYRLEAELIRDQALALSGLLSRKVGGPSVFPPQPDGLWQAAFNGERTWKTSEGEDKYRRGMYVFWRRTVPYPSMAAFDAPSREICTIRRSRTNTPLQAFVTLNDPVYVEAAQGLARRILNAGGATTEDRARYGLQLCLSRLPTDEEVLAVVSLVADELNYYRDKSEDAVKLATEPLGPLAEGVDPVEAAAWTVAANVLLNMDGILTRN